MRPLRLPPLYLSALALAVSCGDSVGPITELPRELSVSEVNLVAADNRFAFKLFAEINAQVSEGNVFVSPLSVAMALGMAYNGAAGSTREAMQQALELQGLTLDEVNRAYKSVIELLQDLDSRVEFVLANSIWHRHTMTLEPEFVDLNRRYFDAQVLGIDFGDPGAAQTINAWVSDRTNGKIREIVSAPLTAQMAVYLIDAIYFDADWTHRFDESQTRPAPFSLADGTSSSVNMMSTGGRAAIRVAWAEDVVVGDLPYGGGAYSMTIVLPSEPAGIGSLTDGLTQERWNGWLAQLSDTEIEVSLPKFTLEYRIRLNDVLDSLGMGVAFEPGLADFTGMCCAPGQLWIHEVLHKTFLDVDEEGTEAAAATSVAITPGSGPTSFRVNRPFVLAIRERLSGTILFMGKVLDPTAP